MESHRPYDSRGDILCCIFNPPCFLKDLVAERFQLILQCEPSGLSEFRATWDLHVELHGSPRRVLCRYFSWHLGAGIVGHISMLREVEPYRS